MVAYDLAAKMEKEPQKVEERQIDSRQTVVEVLDTLYVANSTVNYYWG